jgi:hypothetical protein
MANLMDLLQGQLSEGLIDSLTSQTGGADRQQTGTAASLVMQTLMNAVAKNAQTPDGAAALSGALEKDHDGGILGNVMDLVTGGGQVANSRSADGFGILSHLLGDNMTNVVEMVSKGSGVNRSGSMNMLMKLAPVVLGVLGQQKKQQNMNPNSLMDFLSTSQKQVTQQNPNNNLITKILDRDGDGSAMDEIAGMGMKMLGSFFSK